MKTRKYREASQVFTIISRYLITTSQSVTPWLSLLYPDLSESDHSLISSNTSLQGLSFKKETQGQMKVIQTIEHGNINKAQ